MSFRYPISSIIVSYNCLAPLKACVKSLADQKGKESEIIVIDNHSNDGTVAFLKAQEFKTILSQKNLGYGAAVNRAAREAEGKYIFILNPDTELPPTSLETIYKYAEDNPDVGLISPTLCYPDGRLQLSARKFPRRRDFLMGRGSPLFLLGLTGEREAGYIVPDGDQPIDVPAVSATALFVGSELFHRIGGCDERFFLYLEDIDLCRRVRNIGFRVVLLPSVTVFHSWRKSSRKRPYFSSFHHHLSVFRYFQKHHPDQWLYNLMLLFALAAGLVVSFVHIAVRRGKRK
jgi:N-acetylglucosaminyl-diphospho-decaprenol L-rhamnosyltransferase